MEYKIQLDCFGDICPVPMLKAQKAIESIDVGESVLLITDHSCVVKSMQDKFISSTKIDIEIDEVMNGVWEISLTKQA